MSIELAEGYLKMLLPALTGFFKKELARTGEKILQTTMDKIGGKFYEFLRCKFANQELLESVRNDPMNEKKSSKLEEEIIDMLDSNYDRIREKIITLGKELPSDSNTQIITGSNSGVIVQNMNAPVTINNKQEDKENGD